MLESGTIKLIASVAKFNIVGVIYVKRILTDVPTKNVVGANVSVTSKGYYLTTIEHILESIVLEFEVVYKVVKVHENEVEEVVGGERIELIENAIFEPALIEFLKKLLKIYY